MIDFDSAEIVGAVLRAAEAEIADAAETALRVTVENTIVGNPDLWISPAPADYRPGGARAGWQAFVGGTPGPSIYDPEVRDTVGATTIANALTAVDAYSVADAEAETPIVLANAVPYIVPLNAGEASRQGGFFAEAGVSAAAAGSLGTKPL